ncbi:MAG: quinolinate synthase NadA [Bacteroidales bacterium]|nr:quinolinate synthase NadA [Bacteroidales bacterium]
MLTQEKLIEEIHRLKKEKNAIILAHYYQIPEIQDIADFIGDSLALSQKAKTVDNEIIVFCGVHFMAETAKILNPTKKVILPDLEAGCSLADSCPATDFKEFLKEYPDHKVITYINSSAAVKTMTDIVCTSSNARQIVEYLPVNQKIIFAPDKNLGAYINSVTGRKMVLWEGACHVHNLLTTEAVLKLKMKHTDAKVVAHPECNAAVLAIADYIGSTNGMIKFTTSDLAQKYIVASETGILHQMKTLSPEKEFLVVPSDEGCSCNDCPFMKQNTLEKLYNCMLSEMPEILMSKDLMDKGRVPIERMLEISAELKLI